MHQRFVHRTCKLLSASFSANSKQYLKYHRNNTQPCSAWIFAMRPDSTIHRSSVGRKINQFMPEFGKIMFREAPFYNSQHSMGSSIKFVHLDHFKDKFGLCVSGSTYITYKTSCSFTALSIVRSIWMAKKLTLTNFSQTVS